MLAYTESANLTAHSLAQHHNRWHEAPQKYQKLDNLLTASHSGVIQNLFGDDDDDDVLGMQPTKNMVTMSLSKNSSLNPMPKVEGVAQTFGFPPMFQLSFLPSYNQIFTSSCEDEDDLSQSKGDRINQDQGIVEPSTPTEGIQEHLEFSSESVKESIAPANPRKRVLREETESSQEDSLYTPEFEPQTRVLRKREVKAAAKTEQSRPRRPKALPSPRAIQQMASPAPPAQQRRDPPREQHFDPNQQLSSAQEKGKLKLDQGFKCFLRGVRKAIRHAFKISGLSKGMHHWNEDRWMQRTREFLANFLHLRKIPDFDVAAVVILLYHAIDKKETNIITGLLQEKGVEVFKGIFANNSKQLVEKFLTQGIIRELWPTIIQYLTPAMCNFDKCQPDEDGLTTLEKLSTTFQEISRIMTTEYNLAMPAWWLRMFNYRQ